MVRTDKNHVKNPQFTDKFNEVESRSTPKSYLFDPLPKLTESSPITRYYHFELEIVKLSPDGFERPVWSVNGQYPGPLIQANKGDRLVINVTNNFGDPASIHWHGIFQRETNWYDGMSGQTQCPIPNRISFTYNYTVDQFGTFWYHSHFLAQYVDGFVGPLIVHDSDDPYLDSYHEDYVITVSDWYHSPSAPLLVQRLAPHYTGFNPYPDAALISGLGQYNCSAAPAEIQIRIINTSAYAFFTFSIDNHPLKIIKVEGTPVKNVSAATMNVLQLHIAQRYSVILTADQPIDNYYIRASIIDSCLLPRTNNTINYNSSINFNATGILHYHGADSKNPTSTAYPFTFPLCQDLNASSIRPYKDSPAPTNVTNDFVFNITFARNDDDVGLLGINNSSFMPIFNNPANQRVMLKENYTDFDEDQNPTNHPFHLHGHAFWIIAQGPGAFLSNISTSEYDLENPVIRDTAIIPTQLIERPTEFSNRTLPDDVRALCMQFDNYKKQKRLTTLPRDSKIKRIRMFRKVKNQF
ncbi:hypothetical protein Glove_109g258 [Diversispora epigaea]|uniref:Laccase n=1 Tax=Diversispora epigaea TaxID=1348612 RepID=A0A397J6F1_9GLOM|nr:hypothetical protein Glove_109g258 [Diversispora epigaea]